MATILKPVRLVNPGKRKKRLTARQKLFFGSKRQRAAVARSLGHKRRSNAGKVRRWQTVAKPANRKVKRARSTSQSQYYRRRHNQRLDKMPPSKIPNVGEIITIRPLVNSGTTQRSTIRKRKGTRRKLTNMASKKRRLAGLKAARTRARRKAARSSSHRTRSTRRRRSNPGVRRHRRRNSSVVRTRTRYIRRNAGHRRRGHRRNPGIGGGMGGTFGKAIGVIGGAMLTKVVSGMLPSSLTTGVLGYLSIGIVAMLQGKTVGKILKNPSLGNDLALGGYVYLALKIANDYFPSLGIGLSGMGLIGGSSFYVPQVNQPGSMGTFMLPAAVSGAMAPAVVGGGMKGLGAGTSMRRVGRLR